MKALQILKLATKCQTRRHRRMLRGQFESALRRAGLSVELQDSALREFDRQAARPERY